MTRILIVLAVLIALGAAAGWLVMIRMPGRSHAGPLAPLTADERDLRDRLSRHVHALAGDIGERNLWKYAQLQAASRYVQEQLRASGYDVVVQRFDTMGRAVDNIVAERRGSQRPEEIVVVGAHYDSVAGSPGANDNASGVAALLELARIFTGRTPARTIRFEAFANEEPPFFMTDDMGSLHAARDARVRGDRIVAMLSIETIGWYSDARRSQRYPVPLFGLFYPGTANFVVFVGNVGSRAIVRRAIGSFRAHAAFPSQGAAVPGWIAGVGWSDHWAYWKQGYPAIMVTDTALFRYEPYHTLGDTPDQIDYDRMARVVSGLVPVIDDLANGSDANASDPAK